MLQVNPDKFQSNFQRLMAAGNEFKPPKSANFRELEILVYIIYLMEVMIGFKIMTPSRMALCVTATIILPFGLYSTEP